MNHDDGSSLWITAEWCEEEVNYVRDQLVSFNREQAPASTGLADYETVNVLLKDRTGQVQGGVLGQIFCSVLYIGILWIDENHRKGGYGGKLLHAAEEIAKGKGCGMLHLDTFSFQAPDFYLKHGFQIFGTLEGYSGGIKRFYLKKDL
ncbi:GNAT family N-acetyltransferase [Paenibacillus oenotherae]|uniref:GNAT family N-acetyltransferase n=1 Tax=Paenibacillus oenotherae TaxID=1435645 RepID=A0ABS7DCF6_9BACL|nr:GNAT family N-acetyltransferase [Paenibacillus oenotherae]MBW7477565.1 GNAT family N-acetyltransferase [Paenibacillus oenotherae]